MQDALEDWLAVRNDFDWLAVHDLKGAVRGFRDGYKHFIETVVRARDQHRADVLLVALNQSRSDAAARAPLDFARLCKWQQIILETDDINFRSHPAFAKGGRERYGIRENTQSRFENCLFEVNSSDLPVLSRAARLYFDVLFFHPFADGNSRAAALALDYTLVKEGIYLDEVRPLLMVSRSPDLNGLHAMLRLLEILVEATRSRKPSKTNCISSSAAQDPAH